MLAEAEEVRKEADVAYAKAIPALENAKLAVENLKVEFINEFKSFSKPNEKALDVCIVCNYITRPMRDKAKFSDWKYNVSLMKDPNKFRQSLLEIKDDIEMNTENYAEIFKKVEEILIAKGEHLNLKVMSSISSAANAILDFVINIREF